MYTADFFREEARVARASAEIVIPWIAAQGGLSRYDRVIDVGGGTGEWAYTASKHAAIAVCIDLHAPHDIDIPRLRFDITNGVDCTSWSFAICLEVAEHLPPESGPLLVAGLAKARRVLFSAATPGQPGIGHINCMPHEYWHQLFAQQGMTFKFIGDKFTEPVADFYRRNMFLYGHAA